MIKNLIKIYYLLLFVVIITAYFFDKVKKEKKVKLEQEWEQLQDRKVESKKQELTSKYPWLESFINVYDKNDLRALLLNNTHQEILEIELKKLLSEYATKPIEKHDQTLFLQSFESHINTINEIHNRCDKLYDDPSISGTLVDDLCRQVNNGIFINQDWYSAFRDKNYTNLFLYSQNNKLKVISKKPYYAKVCNLAPYPIFSILNFNIGKRDSITNLYNNQIKNNKWEFRDDKKHPWLYRKPAKAKNLYEGSSDYFTAGWYKIDPGKCSTIELGMWAFLPEEVGIYIDADASITNYLMQFKDYQSYWKKEVSWGGDFQTICASKEVQMVKNPLSKLCKGNQRMLHLQQLEFSENTHSTTMYVMDEGICRANPYMKCDQLDFDSASIYAQRLNNALQRQMYALSLWGNYIFPYSLGFVVNDTNGALEEGLVVIQKTHEQTPFGTVIDAQVGDEIISFNGVALFSLKDLEYAIYDFANTQGVDKLFKYIVQRGNQFFEIEGAFFFNQQYFVNSGICTSAWKGVVNSLTLGKDAQVLCAVPNVLIGMVNGLEAFGAFISKEYQQKQYQYNDYDSCVFQATQEKYMLKQFCSDSYDGAAFIGMVMSPTRAIINLMLNNKRETKKQKSALRRIIRDAAIEAGESAAWSVVDMPPGAPKDQTIGEAIRAAKFGAGISFATSLIVKN